MMARPPDEVVARLQGETVARVTVSSGGKGPPCEVVVRATTSGEGKDYRIKG